MMIPRWMVRAGWSLVGFDARARVAKVKGKARARVGGPGVMEREGVVVVVVGVGPGTKMKTTGMEERALFHFPAWKIMATMG
jgi:hypothetical protein